MLSRHLRLGRLGGIERLRGLHRGVLLRRLGIERMHTLLCRHFSSLAGAVELHELRRGLVHGGHGRELLHGLHGGH